MPYNKRYSTAYHTKKEISSWQRAFFAKAGSQFQLLLDLFDNMPGISLAIKDAKGRVIHTNRFNASISGWQSPSDIIGYTSEELYPPEQAAVYAGRDREVMETGVPIVERLYGNVADHSAALNCVTVRPIKDCRGRRIGTVTIYWRADRKLATANWYNPLRKAIVYLNEHYTENTPIEKLASMSNYSIIQFRRIFKELTHLTPSKYVLRQRINEAKTLLETTDMLITDIALRIGFYDQAHFIRTFRALSGITPAAYRRQKRK